MKKIYFIIIAFLLLFIIVSEVRKKRFSIRESFWWVFAALAAFVLSIFPGIIPNIANYFGIEYPPSILFIFCIVFLVFINFRNSKKIAELQVKVIELGQNVSILKEQNKENKK